MAHYQFFKTQAIKAPLQKVWEFISAPANLKVITPDHMGFDITSSQLSEKMYEGMIISYKVCPIPGFKTNWVTEITHIRENEYFVDEQRVGPYKMWHHQHILEPLGEMVIMKDLITYQPPYGPLGQLANSIFIRSKLEEIFKYRNMAIEKYFEAESHSMMKVI